MITTKNIVKLFSADIYIKDISQHENIVTYWKYKIKNFEFYVPNYGYLVLFDSNFKDLSNGGFTVLNKKSPLEYKIYSNIFKDNILLNLAYLDGRVTSSSQINWEDINKPFHSEFTLQPNEAFAYHNAILPEYKDRVVVTTKARFNKQDGFKTDGYLYGDGVCQLASLINWAARDAQLEVAQFTNHDFAAIPEVPKEFGVAIYLDPNNQAASARKNLYIVNNQSQAVTFNFDYRNGQLTVSVSKVV
jgi:hypothetical protein